MTDALIRMRLCFSDQRVSNGETGVKCGDSNMQTEFMLLAIYNKPRLNLKEVCEAIGMSMKTAYNQRSANTFPIPMSGDPLHADIRDVAAYLDKLRTPAATI